MNGRFERPVRAEREGGTGGKTMAARGLVNGRGPSLLGRDEAKRKFFRCTSWTRNPDEGEMPGQAGHDGRNQAGHDEDGEEKPLRTTDLNDR